MTATYNISVKTSNATAHAGTNSAVEIQMVGEDGSATEWLILEKFLWNPFERGQHDNFTLQCQYVGLPVIVRFKLSNWLFTDDWFCEMVTVETGNLTAQFPLHEWIYDTIEFARGEAQLPQNITNDSVKKQRQDEVAKSKENLRWIQKPTSSYDNNWGFPRCVMASTYEELPRILHRSEVRQNHIQSTGFVGLLNQIIPLIDALIFPIDELQDYHKLYNLSKLKRENPMYLDDWNTDESFGRQVLNGINPVCFKRCKRLPRGCEINNDDVKNVLGGGKTLESEITAGKIYVADYLDFFAGVPRNKHHAEGTPLFCPDCIALFYVNDRGQFLPLAIQLVAGSRDHVFTPEDQHEDWLLAKMYFRCAQSNAHEWIIHYSHTHAIMEPFGVALFRCLPRTHPIHKLLRPHLQTVMMINMDARMNLIGRDASTAKGMSIEAFGMIRKSFKTFTIRDLHIPKLLKKYGTDDPNLLPNYFYRDDALAHWNAMEKYVSAVIRHYYKKNKDVIEDTELQDWAQDVAKQGLGWQDDDTKGMPTELRKVKHLIKICVTLIFTSSVQHAAVNFGQFENYKFIPNSPLAMRLPPHMKGEANMQRILDTLPDAVMASAMISIGFALSEFSPNEIYLGNFPTQLFTEREIIDIQQEYKRDLEDLETSIIARNAGLEHPYTYLMPSRVPSSIAI